MPATTSSIRSATARFNWAYVPTDVGGGLIAQTTRAVSYFEGVASALGTLGSFESQALGINASGLIVGTSRTGGTASEEHAFLFSSGEMSDLNQLVDLAGSNFAYLKVATAINDSGWIVGYGELLGDQGEGAFLLRPLSAIPEPSTVALTLGSVAFAVVASMRSKRRTS